MLKKYSNKRSFLKRACSLVFSFVKETILLSMMLCIFMINLNNFIDLVDSITLTPPTSSIQVEKDLPRLQPSDSYNYEHAVVRLYANEHFFCSGVVIGSNYVLTASHCLVDKDGLMRDEEIVVVNDSGEVVVRARPVGVNLRMDHGLVKGDFSKIPAAKLNSSHMVIPSFVMACGYSLGSSALDCTLLEPKINDAFLIKCTGNPLLPGQSGGPVFDKDGNVIGLNVQVYDASDGGGSAYTPVVGILSEFNIE